MKSSVALIRTIAAGAIAAMAVLAATAIHAADTDKKYTKEEFKSDVKAAGKGVKDAAVEVGQQVGTGTKKAYNSAKGKIKKDVKDGKPGDGSLAKKNESTPAVTEGRKTN
jgi:outer membrane lipoprotein-sorting protein